MERKRENSPLNAAQRANWRREEVREGWEIAEKRQERIKHFNLGGGRRQAVVFAEPVHYQENGAWREIDNNLDRVEENGKVYLRNRANPLRMELAATSAGDLVKVSSGGKTLSWRIEGAGAVEAEVKSGAQLRRDALVKRAQGVKRFAGRSASTLSDRELATVYSQEEARIDLTGKMAQVEYRQILPGVTARYTLMGRRIKEDIILDNKQAAESVALILNGGGAGLPGSRRWQRSGDRPGQRKNGFPATGAGLLRCRRPAAGGGGGAKPVGRGNAAALCAGGGCAG